MTDNPHVKAGSRKALLSTVRSDTAIPIPVSVLLLGFAPRHPPNGLPAHSDLKIRTCFMQLLNSRALNRKPLNIRGGEKNLLQMRQPCKSIKTAFIREFPPLQSKDKMSETTALLNTSQTSTCYSVLLVFLATRTNQQYLQAGQGRENLPQTGVINCRTVDLQVFDFGRVFDKTNT